MNHFETKQLLDVQETLLYGLTTKQTIYVLSGILSGTTILTKCGISLLGVVGAFNTFLPFATLALLNPDIDKKLLRVIKYYGEELMNNVRISSITKRKSVATFRKSIK